MGRLNQLGVNLGYFFAISLSFGQPELVTLKINLKNGYKITSVSYRGSGGGGGGRHWNFSFVPPKQSCAP